MAGCSFIACKQKQKTYCKNRISKHLYVKFSKHQTYSKISSVNDSSQAKMAELNADLFFLNVLTILTPFSIRTLTPTLS